ncbi:MAG: 16S rRNA (adenine(1518)-N(6)/adenine(1519)-N(6))-dimethyltransferase RsmA [Syntrophorhabdaceae bacterium]|nr:16S rRNA (adenine(1518)-N(6)/adenine(1519)-N(6))-dimethyltransferase RsmA [Syntrophorhabdaceae bacterium]
MLKKGLSQHLIKDINIHRKIVRFAGLKKDDVVVEIGAGQGDLTLCLAEKAGSVYAIEYDTSFAPYLEEIEKIHPNVKVIYGDFLKITLKDFKDEKNIKLIGNIPYKITGPIIMKGIRERDVIDSMFLMVQKEIAQRVVSKPCRRTYNALSVNCQIFGKATVHFYIKPQAFIPPPKVESAFFSIKFYEEERYTEAGIIDFVKACFENKRKLLRHALTRYFGEERVEELYRWMGFPRTVRAEELEPYIFKEMFMFLREEE